MVLTVTYNQINGKQLQCQKKDEVNMSSDKLNDISQSYSGFGILGSERLPHNERKPIIIFQGNTGSAYHALQRIIGNVNGEFYFIGQPLVEAA